MPRTTIAIAVLCLPVFSALHAQGRGGAVAVQPGRIPTIEERAASMQKFDGYFPLYWEERTRSAFYMERTKAFPKNSEIEVTLTFANEATGGRGGFGAGPAQGPQPIQIPTGAPAGGRGGRGFGGGLFSGTIASVTPSPD